MGPTACTTSVQLRLPRVRGMKWATPVPLSLKLLLRFVVRTLASPPPDASEALHHIAIVGRPAFNDPALTGQFNTSQLLGDLPSMTQSQRTSSTHPNYWETCLQ
jgi:hypothetical protein